METHTDNPHDLIAKIDIQVEKLRQELTTLIDRREKVVQLIALSKELGLPVPGPTLPPLPLPPPLPQRTGMRILRNITPPIVGPQESIRIRASNRVAAYLSDGSFQKTGALLKRLDDEGISVGGKDRILALSAILSKDERFQASRKDGWSLKDEV